MFVFSSSYLFSPNTVMILVYYFLASITVENFAVDLIVILGGRPAFVLWLLSRSSLFQSFSACSLQYYRCGFIHLVLFNIFMFLHL